MRTKQETFDFVVQHLYQQGKPAMDEEGYCLYRTKDGLMCAVGCLIPDEMYYLSMEKTPIDSLIASGMELPPEVFEYTPMLQQLQRVHDSWLKCTDFSDHLDSWLPGCAEYHGVLFTRPVVEIGKAMQ